MGPFDCHCAVFLDSYFYIHFVGPFGAWVLFRKGLKAWSPPPLRILVFYFILLLFYFSTYIIGTQYYNHICRYLLQLTISTCIVVKSQRITGVHKLLFQLRENYNRYFRLSGAPTFCLSSMPAECMGTKKCHSTPISVQTAMRFK